MTDELTAAIDTAAKVLMRDLLSFYLDMIADVDPSHPLAVTTTTEESEAAYAERNTLIIGALNTAMQAGMTAGIKIDPGEPEWPVVYIDLPTGQVAWHIRQYPGTFDGHSTPEKYDRIKAYTALVLA